jgi:RNA polymerase sigma-70 factor (ECF subfamily)
MAYASASSSFSGRTRAAVSVSELLPVFRMRKRNAVLTSRRPASHESHKLVEAGPEVAGMEAFQEMFVASRSKFVAMAHAILRNREDAEDAVQNAFLSGHRHLRSFEGRSALKTWFTRIVLNAALMIRRKRKSPWTSPLPETGTSDYARWMQGISASQPDPEMVYAEREAVQFINKMLGKMKPAVRRALTMTYYDELSGPEACALLGVSAGTFKARLFRAKRQLLNQAQQAFEGPIRKTTASASFPKKNDIQPLAARQPEIGSLEVSLS